jgi:hypothetical protein
MYGYKNKSANKGAQLMSIGMDGLLEEFVSKDYIYM